MATIASAGNAETACLQALIDKGYAIHATEIHPDWMKIALKDGKSFAAENFMELLGLVTVWEMWGDKWQEMGLGRYAPDSTWDKIIYDDE